MSNNLNLHRAKILKRDSFYTVQSTVEAELCYYGNHFKGKTILCNCDDNECSEFFKYFQKRFEILGLKKLIGVHYESEKGKPSYKLELYKDTNNDGKVTWEDRVIKTPIYGDEKYTAGDFRSKDCIELLKEADLVVTNPPFSLLREFIAQLIKYNKKFLIIGNKNAIGCKEIFPLFKENKIRLGVSIHSGSVEFRIPSNQKPDNLNNYRLDEDGNIYVKNSSVRWFTNLNTSKRDKPLQLSGFYYTKESYPKYDNYDAINVDKVADIPCDYPGIMGVPLTFMDKYCPEQFKILGISGRGNNVNFKTKIYTKEDADNYSDHNAHPVLLKGGRLKSLYTRIFIKTCTPRKVNTEKET